ncbi:PREDICTED: uncharacterized protein LOC108569940 isoform X11 [Nicrophorus vespilloides]|uniref:Uncharacterized protein LOC108569940 isoform X11 n=1 Tax=Nicrophorus vespilloides TaxID=110193 RepID=A0ABM1NK55_NICVS|nr:PREDICTED: uncharacterized protein LOC108569940 isoform X11 [Nicrophorus vespilloides]
MEPVYNESSLETDTEFGELYRYTELIGTALSLIGIVANILIITTILSSKSLQTRTYLLLLNWSIFNILFRLTSDNLLHVMLINMEINVEMICVTMNLDTMFRFAEMVFLLALISNWVLKSYKISDLVILLIFYATITSSLLVVTSLCMLDIETELIYALGGVTYLCLLINVIIKNANRFCKAKGDPLSPETVKRLNLASIYTLWTIASFIVMLSAYIFGIFIFIQISAMSTFLIPLIFILYLSKVDQTFKCSFLALINCRRLPDNPTENNNECCNNP